MIGEIHFFFLVVYRSTFKVVLTIFRILFCKKPFQPVLFLPHHFNCPVITPSDYTLKTTRMSNFVHIETFMLKPNHLLDDRELFLRRNALYEIYWILNPCITKVNTNSLHKKELAFQYLLYIKTRNQIEMLLYYFLMGIHSMQD